MQRKSWNADFWGVSAFLSLLSLPWCSFPSFPLEPRGDQTNSAFGLIHSGWFYTFLLPSRAITKQSLLQADAGIRVSGRVSRQQLSTEPSVRPRQLSTRRAPAAPVRRGAMRAASPLAALSAPTPGWPSWRQHSPEPGVMLWLCGKLCGDNAREESVQCKWQHFKSDRDEVIPLVHPVRETARARGGWFWLSNPRWVVVAEKMTATTNSARLAVAKHVTTANYRTAYIASESFSYVATSKQRSFSFLNSKYRFTSSRFRRDKP